MFNNLAAILLSIFLNVIYRTSTTLPIKIIFNIHTLHSQLFWFQFSITISNTPWSWATLNYQEIFWFPLESCIVQHGTFPILPPMVCSYQKSYSSLHIIQVVFVNTYFVVYEQPVLHDLLGRHRQAGSFVQHDRLLSLPTLHICNRSLIQTTRNPSFRSLPLLPSLACAIMCAL